jgi:hypothetical protein
MDDIKAISYPPFLEEILSKIQLARYEMLKTVSKQTVTLYWEIGKAVSQKVQQEKWGKSIVEQLSKDLQTEFPGIRGFSARNIWRMKTFYEFYIDNEKLPPLVAEIGWVQKKSPFKVLMVTNGKETVYLLLVKICFTLLSIITRLSLKKRQVQNYKKR